MLVTGSRGRVADPWLGARDPGRSAQETDLALRRDVAGRRGLTQGAAGWPVWYGSGCVRW
jgi:hypothetical protein